MVLRDLPLAAYVGVSLSGGHEASSVSYSWTKCTGLGSRWCNSVHVQGF